VHPDNKNHSIHSWFARLDHTARNKATKPENNAKKRTMTGTFLSGTVPLTLSIVLILHAAFSLQHYRALMQDILEDNASLPNSLISTTTTTGAAAVQHKDHDIATHIAIPLDIWLEISIGYGILVVSELWSRGSMQPVLSKGRRPRPIVAPVYRTRDFDIYETRARGLKL
jgi:hypothetical protein